MKSSGPLAGIVVLDFTRVLSGPFCTMMLADLGATVIKIEQPQTGDDSRTFPPFIDGESTYFTTYNRGKKSIALDLKNDADKIILMNLISKSDVLVENFTPGTLERLGFGWSSLHAKHPPLIYASISGFGQTGPYRDRKAYDLIVQAMGGLMSINGHPGQPPIRMANSIGDLAASLFAANGIQAAIIERHRTGVGSRIDISMLESQVALLEVALSQYAVSGKSPEPIGARHAGAAPFDVFKTADGYIAIAAGSKKLFDKFCHVIGDPQLLDEPAYIDKSHRVINEAALKIRIEAVLASKSVDEWMLRLEKAGIPAGAVNNVAAVIADSQVKNRGALIEIKGSPGFLAAVTPCLSSTHPYPTQHPPAPKLDGNRSEILEWMHQMK